MKYCSIGEAASKLNIPESTIRYYEKKGLLPLMERDGAGRRLFSEDQMALLETVMRLKNTLMPISKIKQYVDWVIEGSSTNDRRLDMMTKHKQAVLAQIALMTESLIGIDVKIARYTKRKHEEKEGLE
ncbi:DNA-binding transcriptional MerR regulator [Paenibacillus taihuensis]|uniref:DNA-binding transcriptional MerR regulator n=1 Tax=Paenibacillus taihuensis TaxID=1156355 RepID=A0A3D9RHU7_9BACL|nr:MerR family transcriptional regulator [Paenibacillus taihuensis]REE78688.1 DNA-binding transcriptional MerR regulator [Paenibacillus taihuensis]